MVIIGGGSGDTGETRLLNVEQCYRFESVRHSQEFFSAMSHEHNISQLMDFCPKLMHMTPGLMITKAAHGQTFPV